ncbi:type 1 secretion target domain-containng protein [Rhizobium sp. PDO1-076]|nr:type 1 secretion target domain-containng protein [Rhizobium sp. PDO1-076]
MTVKLSVGSGKLNVAAGDSGVVVTNSGTSTVTLVGTITEINALLAGGGTKTVTYIADSDTPLASTTLTLSVNDGGSTGSGGAESDTDTATINITAVNDAPTAAITPTSYNATEQVDLALQGTGLTIGDIDAASDEVVVTLAVGFGKLTIDAGDSGVNVGRNGTMSVTLTGSIAEINALLAGGGSGSREKTITYLADSDTPPGSTVLTMVVNDGANNGTGGALIATDTATINIAAVNDATSYIADHVYTNAASGGNSSIPEWALLFNDDKDNLLDLTQVKNPSGFDSIQLSGSNILIDDNNSAGGSFQYRAGSTDVSVNLYRDSDTDDMDGSSGNDIIIDVFGGNTDLDGNGGNDILIGNDGIDTMTGDTGADVFVIGADSVSVGIHDIITDYDMADGDVIDLSEILAGLASNTALESSYVKLVQNGGNAELQVDTDGAGATKSFETVAVLNSFNVTTEHVRILFNDHKNTDDV